jgi:signal transduction histidine kinase
MIHMKLKPTYAELEQDLEEKQNLLVLKDAALDNARKQYQADLLSHEILQTKKLETLGSLIQRVTHDLNNLLTMVSGYIQLVQPQNQDPGMTLLLSKSQDVFRQMADKIAELYTLYQCKAAETNQLSLRELIHDLEGILVYSFSDNNQSMFKQLNIKHKQA